MAQINPQKIRKKTGILGKCKRKSLVDSGNADSDAGCVQAKFCSPACLGWSWQQGHRHESGLLHLVDSKEIGRMATLAYRYMDMVEYSRDKEVRPREECADRAMLDA